MDTSSRRLWSDDKLLELWRAGRITTEQLSVSERERLNLLVIREAIEASKPEEPKKSKAVA